METVNSAIAAIATIAVIAWIATIAELIVLSDHNDHSDRSDYMETRLNVFQLSISVLTVFPCFLFQRGCNIVILY